LKSLDFVGGWVRITVVGGSHSSFEVAMKKLLLALLFLTTLPAVAAVPAEDYYNAGISLFQQKDYDKAIQYFHAAIQEKNDFWQAYQFLGEAYYQDSNRTEAVVAIQQSLKLHHDNPDLRKFLATIQSNSPWVAQGSWRDWLILLTFLFSVAALFLTVYFNKPAWLGLKKSHSHHS
jgi:tetratricopeptide (TPR) repeat protein